MSSKMQKNPSIRFKGFTDAWEQCKVRELFTVTRGQVLAATKTKDKETDEFIYPVYSSQTKNNGLMGFYNQYLFENAITWTTDGANAGTVNFRKGKFYSTNVNGVLLSDKGYANKAISEIINKIAWKHVSKVGNPKLMNNIMSEITIMIPSIEELNKISILFNQIDNTIALHQRQLNDYKQLKKSMLQNMFPQEGETIPKVRLDGFTEEWKQCKLKDAVNGDISDGDWIEKEHIHDEGVYRIIQTGNLGVGTYIDKKDTAKFMNQSSFDTLKANEIYPGDILISRLADPAGRTIVLPESSDRMVTAVDVTVIRPNENFDADFFVAEMNSEKNLNEVAKQVSGTSHKRISRKNLENVEINVTSLAEQKQIGAFFKTLEDTIVLHQQKLSNYQALKSTFLQKMFM